MPTVCLHCAGPLAEGDERFCCAGCEAAYALLTEAGLDRYYTLRDGPATHEAQLRAIAAARDHVHLITYILSDDEVSREYLRALGERSQAGVKVRLMFDSVGGRTVGQD